MNIHERSLNVFMNDSWMFLNKKWDVHKIEVVDERPGTQVVQ